MNSLNLDVFKSKGRTTLWLIIVLTIGELWGRRGVGGCHAAVQLLVVAAVWFGW